MPKFSDLPIIDDHSQKVLENIIADILNEMPSESLKKLKDKFQEEREHFDDGVHPIAEIAFKAVVNYGSTRHILRDVLGIMNWIKINRFPYIENRYELEETLFPNFEEEEQGRLLDEQLQVMQSWIMFSDAAVKTFQFHLKNHQRQLTIAIDWQTHEVLWIRDEVEGDFWNLSELEEDMKAAINWLTFS
jgi:hypothetical protein